MTTLAQRFDALSDAEVFPLEVARSVADNLAPHIALRPYQVSALGRFAYYVKGYNRRERPSHLLFHMATGSGKTVIMAALILDLYERGYRNFMFFVNARQIIEKTKANFLDPASSKYLFADPLRFDGKPVRVREVSNFDESDPDGINIHFTTIQLLHGRMGTAHENAMSEDFADREVVLISDEAHHLNAETLANPGQGELNLRASWQSTVARIFKANPGNFLLEFTATANFSHPALAAKYKDKILCDYPLRQFRADRYSKEIALRPADVAVEDRMLHAVILSQYRRKLAGEAGLSLKPVVMMKSWRVSESAQNEARFHALIAALDGARLDAAVAALPEGDPVLSGLRHVLRDRLSFSAVDFAREIRLDFAPAKVRNVNSPDDLARLQMELNSLEDRDNEVRCIFAVDKLNEGWDVLNLFDIVRLYNRGSNVTTNQEAQLIGRGARYWPFTLAARPAEPRERRKLDSHEDDPLRALETLHYHCTHSPAYITDIRRALADSGLLDRNTHKVTVRLRDSFRQSDFFRNGVVFMNERRTNARAGILSLQDYRVPRFIRIEAAASGRINVVDALGEGGGQIAGASTRTRSLRFADLGRPVVRHALDARPFFHFANLKRHFPSLAGMTAFMDEAAFLGGVEIEIRAPAAIVDSPDARTRLTIAGGALDRIEAEILANSHDHVGTRDFTPHAMPALIDDATISVGGAFRKHWREHDDTLDLAGLDWFAQEDFYGTSEEVKLIRFFKDRMDALRAAHGEVRLIRNEKAVKLFAFEDGAAFEPDFLLYLERDGDGGPATVQIFLEPKGAHLMAGDEWKDRFLRAIEGQAQVPAIGGRTFKVKGMPLFNEEDWQAAQAFRDAQTPNRHA